MKLIQVLVVIIALSNARGFAADPILFSTELTSFGGQPSQVFIPAVGLQDGNFSIILGSSAGSYHTMITDGGMITVFDFGNSVVNNTIEGGTVWSSSVLDAPLTIAQQNDLIAGNWTVSVQQNSQVFSGQLTVVPEPSTIAIAGACLAGLLGAHRRRKRSS